MQGPFFPQEVFSEIFEYLDPGTVTPTTSRRECTDRCVRQRTLARLARTCQGFTGPALNVLWRVIDGLVALFSILPSFQCVNGKNYVSVI